MSGKISRAGNSFYTSENFLLENDLNITIEFVERFNGLGDNLRCERNFSF